MSEHDRAGAPAQAFDWVAIRKAYETRSLTIKQICEQFGVSKGALENRKRQQAWIPRSGKASPNTEMLVRRMLTVLDQHVKRLEVMTMNEQNDKDVALLASLVNSAAKLAELEQADRARQPKQHKDMREMRDKLAKRIEQLKSEQ